MRGIAIYGLVIALILFSVDQQAWAQKRSRSRRPTGPVLKVGEKAPDFELPRLDPFLKAQREGRDLKKVRIETVKLSDRLGNRPVLLLFSSYT